MLSFATLFFFFPSLPSLFPFHLFPPPVLQSVLVVTNSIPVKSCIYGIWRRPRRNTSRFLVPGACRSVREPVVAALSCRSMQITESALWSGWMGSVRLLRVLTPLPLLIWPFGSSRVSVIINSIGGVCVPPESVNEKQAHRHWTKTSAGH